MKKRFISILLALLMVVSLLLPLTASAADLSITNHGFESGLTGWTQRYGSGGITAVAEQKHSGSQSVKIVDSSTTTSYGTESNFISAAPGTSYYAYAWTYMASGSADLYIRFWNSSHTCIDSGFVSKSSPSGQWTYMKVGRVAPANTAYVTVLLYSNAANTGTVYFDDVFITQNFTNLGVQVTNETIHGAAFGKDGSGNDVIYAAADGSADSSAKLSIINVNTLAVANNITIPGATGSWSVSKANDGTIYIGAYSNGHLYQHVPGSTAVTDLGQAVAGDSFIYSLVPGWNNKIYGGTYIGCNVFKYEPGIGFTRFGPSPFEPGEQYVRSLEYDQTNNITYAGIGAHAYLKRFDNNSGQTDQILPSQYAGEEFVYDLDLEGGKLFSRMAPSKKCPVLTVTEDQNHNVTTTVDCEIDLVSSLGVSPLHNGRVYYTRNGILHYYDIAAKTYASLNANFGFNPTEFGLVQLTDQTNYPGYSVVAIGCNYGTTKVAKYNIQTGYLKVTEINIPAGPTNIRSICKGPDNRMYTNGYLNGGLAAYTPLRSDLDTEYKGIGQAEGMYTLDSKMYFGVYPGGIIYDYDPSQPWKMNTNPRKLFDLSSYEQDRPFGMTGDGVNKLFIGTLPNYGVLGGALTVYDASTETYAVYEDIVPDQSVVCLAYYNGFVYGGTTVWGGMGIDPTQSKCKLLKFNASTGQKTIINLPAAARDLKAITSVTVGPDNKIWGMAEGYLFIYNPDTNAFDYFQDKFPEINYSTASHVCQDANLLKGKDGNVFGTIKGTTFFRINASDKSITTLSTSGARYLAADEYGNLYYADGTELIRYAF